MTDFSEQIAALNVMDTGAIFYASKWKYYTGEPPPPQRWLIKNILPEVGVGLAAGQWGFFKTTTALDLSLSVMTGLDFADRYRVKRMGGVCYFAPEGSGGIDNRLYTAAQYRGIDGELPFVVHAECPALTDKNAADTICYWIADAEKYFQRTFGRLTVLVWFDTLITAAQYATAGGDNDSAQAQAVMNTLRAISERTGAFSIGVDHFGKVIETGTRGSSAKEGAADTVIVLLGTRELTGSITNTRLALRKQRDGISGFEVPFSIINKEAGVDEDGDVITAPPVIDWQATAVVAKSDKRWTASMRILRRVLLTMLDGGRDIHPFPDGPKVRACDVEAVRAEFYRQYPADGTDEKKADTRGKAWRRTIKNATERDLVCVREMNGIQFVWFAKADDEQADT
jgi:hypothetical protein